MSSKQIADAENAVRGLFGADVVRLLRPVLRREHAMIVETIERLPWAIEPMDIVGHDAVEILVGATKLGGPIDPKDDDADIVWAVTLNKVASAPAIGSKMARAWYLHGMRLLWDDAEVSTVFQAMASYFVAASEDALNHPHEVARWIKTAAVETEVDDRVGLGLAVVLRAARLVTGDWEPR
jgi:hypothetical protein